jgi:ankyrin repeat protein
MEIIKKILKPDRNWSSINIDIERINFNEITRKSKSKLIELLVRFDQPQLLEKIPINKGDLNFTDRYGRTVLHHAVENRSLDTLKVLLNSSGNIINRRDKFWFFSPLHFAILNNDINCVKELIAHGADVNLKADHSDLKKIDIDQEGFMYPNRIRPIHLASFGGKLEILKLLITHGATLNPHAEKDGLTPLFMASIEYTSKKGKKNHLLLNVIKYLITSGANIKSVNYDGESLLYYQNIWDNDELFYLFAPHINVNSINYNKDTVLHNNILTTKTVNVKKHAFLLERMDSFYINYPNDFFMDTLMHLYSRNGLWKKLEHILSKKYLDIYSLNKDGYKPIDYIDSKDKSRYLKMCSNSSSNNSLIKVPSIYINPGKFKLNWWLETAFDIFFCLVYLAKKYKGSICFLGDFKFTNGTSHGTSGNLNRYHSINDLFEDNITKFCFLWKNDVLTVNRKYHSAIKNCTTRFFVIPLALNYGRSNEGHFNSILIDYKLKTIERFEPHGYKSSWYHNQKLMDKKLSSILKKLLPTFKYIYPHEFINRIGFQGFDSTSKTYDITQFIDIGYCVVWSFWYINLRLDNPDIPRNKLIELAILKIHKKYTSTKKFIMAYSNSILKLRNKLLKDCKISIDDYVSERTSTEDIKCLLNRIKSHAIPILK